MLRLAAFFVLVEMLAHVYWRKWRRVERIGNIYAKNMLFREEVNTKMGKNGIKVGNRSFLWECAE